MKMHFFEKLPYLWCNYLYTIVHHTVHWLSFSFPFHFPRAFPIPRKLCWVLTREGAGREAAFSLLSHFTFAFTLSLPCPNPKPTKVVVPPRTFREFPTEAVPLPPVDVDGGDSTRRDLI
jgi:hypothetical protein